jgi:SAM-dependent methyltransferase
MALNWINPEDFSFNCFLLMDKFQIQLMMKSGGWRNNKTEWRQSMGIALKANPAVKWYFQHKCPECEALVEEITTNAPDVIDLTEIRKAEIYTLISVEDFVIYTKPHLMETNCDFIKGWDKSRLYEMADFNNKIVLDVGSGSGRLAFAAAEQAEWVYASEPVDNLREYMRDKIVKENIKNVRVVDGMAHSLAYPDNTFDIVMSGHVVGDDWDNELAELTRVCKPCGWLLDCPGDSVGDMKFWEDSEKRGFETMYYKGSYGKDVYRYRKQIIK